MATYSNLKPETYYLIKEQEDLDVILIYVLMETENALFIEYENEEETLLWKKKTDTFVELVEELTEEQAEQYESIVYEEEEEDLWDLDDEQDILESERNN